MPTTNWNKQVWTEDLDNRKESDLPYYGAHWGDPNPANAFPTLIGRLLPEAFLARLLTWKRLRNFLNRRRPDGARYRPVLYRVVQQYLRPFVQPDSVILEIGSGGGRWTDYLIAGRQVIVVEISAEFFDYLKAKFHDQTDKIRFYQTRDYELEGIMSASVDFVFSYGTFVHIDPEGIQAYLAEIARVLKPNGRIVIQYANKEKLVAQQNQGFSDMTPAKMEAIVRDLPALQWVEHNTAITEHSSIAVLKKS